MSSSSHEPPRVEDDRALTDLPGRNGMYTNPYLRSADSSIESSTRGGNSWRLNWHEVTHLGASLVHTVSRFQGSCAKSRKLAVRSSIRTNPRSTSIVVFRERFTGSAFVTSEQTSRSNRVGKLKASAFVTRLLQRRELGAVRTAPQPPTCATSVRLPAAPGHIGLSA